MIRWEKLSNSDHRAIKQIVDRLIDYGHIDQMPIDRLSATMDIAAAHLKTPLRLEDLQKADEFNFKHDVYGIMNHINRNTGELNDFFTPRFTRSTK